MQEHKLILNNTGDIYNGLRINDLYFGWSVLVDLTTASYLLDEREGFVAQEISDDLYAYILENRGLNAPFALEELEIVRGSNSFFEPRIGSIASEENSAAEAEEAAKAEAEEAAKLEAAKAEAEEAAKLEAEEAAKVEAAKVFTADGKPPKGSK